MLYKGDTVRLLRELSEPALSTHVEGTVTSLQQNEEGHPAAAEVCFYAGSQTVNATVPLDAVELVLSSTGGCTAVFWWLKEPPEALIEAAMHSLLDHGFEMRQGLNVVQLIYDHNHRRWRKGDRLSDSTGAQVVAAGPEWDGCIAAFSGPQRFELEFRLRGARPPYVMLHQRWEAYGEQRCSTPPAMTLFRVLLNLYERIGAGCCAIPVADHWLMDESWDSLLQQPYYPDLFLIPESSLPSELPALFRAQRLVNGKAILTTLPVKFSSTDDSIERKPHELELDALRGCEAIGEKAYDQMYDSRSPTGLYSDAKEAFRDAISIAEKLGLQEEAERLSKRLNHIKAVFRSQFT